MMVVIQNKIVNFALGSVYVYDSQTCADLHDHSIGLYLYGDLYVEYE